jgi:hypothetical protein
MFNWAKQQLANVAGTSEPIYGPSAIKSVAEEAQKKPYTELTKKDFKFKKLDTTSVETQVFYIFTESGHIVLLQIIYSNVAGIHTTCQFNSKIFARNASEKHLWCASPLSNLEFSEDDTSLYATDCAVEMSEDGNSYTIKSMNNAESIVNAKITRVAPAFHAGETGNTLYGTDLSKPWGNMRHAFWPRCTAEGTVTTKQGPVDLKGQGIYIMAIQGMKPHHAAAKWNFVNFQGPKYSAVMMEFTTPPSYGSTVVNVGAIATDSELVYAGCTNTATHTETKLDAEIGWKEPTAVKFAWSGKTKDGKPLEAVIEGPFGPRTDRVDVMAEVPGFVKNIVAGTVGTKPYIYQFSPKMTLKIKTGEEEITEEGQLFSEATFISE